jgi:transposase
VIPSQIIRQYTYAYGAVCPEDGAFVSLILPTMQTGCMNVFLNEMSVRYPDNHLAVVLDGAACHRSRSLNIPENMTLIPLPPYSPELNPQENVWKDMRAEGFYNRVFESMDAVEEALVKVCRLFESSTDRLRRLTHYPWIAYALKQ